MRVTGTAVVHGSSSLREVPPPAGSPARGSEYVASHVALTDPAGRPSDHVPGVTTDSLSDYGWQDVRQTPNRAGAQQAQLATTGVEVSSSGNLTQPEARLVGGPGHRARAWSDLTVTCCKATCDRVLHCAGSDIQHDAGTGSSGCSRYRRPRCCDRGQTSYLLSASARRSMSSSTLPDLGNCRLASWPLSSALVRLS